MFSLGSGSVDEALAVGDPLRYEFFDAATTPETIDCGGLTDYLDRRHDTPRTDLWTLSLFGGVL